MKRLPLFFILFFLFVQSISAQDAEFWYEYKLKNMSLDEKIGQLFMVAAYSNKNNEHTAEIEHLISNYHIGGLIFFQDDPLKQAYLTNYYQSISKYPLMIGIDGEWGLNMRLKNTQKFPYSISLGALNNNQLVYDVGAAIGRECKRMGIHINFAPDADINNNPQNPIIGFRSFGDNKYNVAQKSIAYSNGLMSQHVLSCAKHFPGHGDVHTDSHLDLPVVDKFLQELDSMELYPFKQLIQSGVPSIMVAHISFPQLDSRHNRSASLSKYIIDTLLKQKMDFNGLVFTDAMNMKGVAKYYSNGRGDLEAFLAGNDIILFSENVPTAVALIKQAVLDSTISMDDLNKRVLKILKWKQFVGLDHYEPIVTSNLIRDLNPNENLTLFDEIALKSVSYANKVHETCDIENSLFISINDEGEDWKNCLKTYNIKHHLTLSKSASKEKIAMLVRAAEKYKNVVISYHNPKIWSQQSGGYQNSDFDIIKSINRNSKVTVIGFCNPYVLKKIDHNVNIIAAYEDNVHYQKAALALLKGQIASEGKLPVELGMKVMPEKDENKTYMGLNAIDQVAQQLISKKAAPGCRIYVLKDGKEIFNRSYGHLNYDKAMAVNDSTMYDLASITKVAATTLAVMKLYDEGQLDIQQTLGHYVSRLKGSNKENLLIADVLQHRSGLTAWIPFYKETLPYVDSIYCAINDSAYCIKVADKFYMLSSNKDTVYKRIIDSKLESKTYRYSDLSMILMQLVVESISGESLDSFVYKNFYDPMGLTHIGFNPWKQYPMDNIAPTQDDRLFRNQKICGYVHDPGAAMLGGVSGHAGVFSTSQDLAHLMSMLENGGIYNNKQYISKRTIDLFTSYQRGDSRRGLGFDKPDFLPKHINPASDYCSKSTFGHTGFTGTCVWVDPEAHLVFVFLSNRICPDEENRELISGNYRTRIQDIVYQSIK
jgi:beta-N-acetylhexosaminidase